MWVECDKNYEPLDVGEVKIYACNMLLRKYKYSTTTQEHAATCSVNSKPNYDNTSYAHAPLLQNYWVFHKKLSVLKPRRKRIVGLR